MKEFNSFYTDEMPPQFEHEGGLINEIFDFEVI